MQSLGAMRKTNNNKNKQSNDSEFNCERCDNNRFFSLKRKSVIYLISTSFYILFVAAYLINEKDKLLSHFSAYQQAANSKEVLVATSHSLRIINTNLLKGFLNNEPVDLMKTLHVEFIELQNNYTQLQPLYPKHARQFKDLVKLLAHLIITSSPQASAALKPILIDNQSQLDDLLQTNHLETQRLLNKYHDSIHKVAINASLLGLLGILIFGSILIQFFKRMTGDISSLHNRVKKIMNGYRYTDLNIQRNDELELLACGINEMAHTLKQSEAELELERRKQYTRKKQGAIEHLAAGLVHELGNPVAAISALTDALQSNDNQLEKQEITEQITLYTKRMSGIIKGLSKLANRLDNDLQLIDMNNLIKSSVELWNLDERSYGIQTNIDLEPQLPAVNGIEEQLNQVLNNLIINAYEALNKTSVKNKQISISTAYSNQNLVIKIADNGCGMEPELIDQAIETFYSSKENAQESGLGLPLCRSIIMAHQGRLSISSTPCNGTNVQIVLPEVN